MSSPQRVFINCPFDPGYRQMFDALVFAVLHCGFSPTSALEAQGSGKQRFSRIIELIRRSPLAIHDLSRTSLGGERRLPRFNMPLELGIFIGAREFGGDDQRKKDYLVLEKREGDCDHCCSDLGGVDASAHDNQPAKAIEHVRNWLNAHSPGGLSGPEAIATDYRSFRSDLPAMLDEWKLKQDEVTFLDFRKAAAMWLQGRPKTKRSK